MICPFFISTTTKQRTGYHDQYSNMPYLSDIEEVTEMTEETNTKKGGVTIESDAIDFSFRMSINDEKSYNCEEFSETAPSTKTSKAPSSVMVSIDPSFLQRISNMDDDTDDDTVMRKSELCCFSCCDLVRACVITNAIYIVLMIFLLLISIFEFPNFHRFDLYNSEGDDYFYSHGNYEDSLQRSMNVRGILALVRTGCAILFSVIGIIGALRFSKHTVLSAAVWNCVYIVWSCIDRRTTGAVIAVFFAYPNWHLFLTLRNRTISRENYSTEKYCCCKFCYNIDDSV